MESTPTDAIEWGTDTDASLYTCSTEEPLSSVAEQSTAYLLEIRNLLLILLLSIFCVKIYQFLKNTIINFYER